MRHRRIAVDAVGYDVVQAVRLGVLAPRRRQVAVDPLPPLKIKERIPTDSLSPWLGAARSLDPDVSQSHPGPSECKEKYLQETREQVELRDYQFHRLEAFNKQRQQSRLVKMGFVPRGEGSSSSSSFDEVNANDDGLLINDPEHPSSMFSFHDWVLSHHKSGAVASQHLHQATV